MIGLFGLLNMGTRSLQAQRAGVETAGQNLANVNNPAYARQRVSLATSISVTGETGPQGTGVDAVSIQQLRNALLDKQITVEASDHGALTARQTALQYAQAALGAQIDRLASGAEGAAAAQGVGGANSLADTLSGLFNSFQDLASNPTSSAVRQALLMKADGVASQIKQLDSRLTKLNTSLNQSISSDVSQVNQLLTEIADLNSQIGRVESARLGSANDLRDTRQERLEALAKYVNIDLTDGANSAIDVAIGGVAMVSGNNVVDRIQTFDTGSGQLMLQAATAGTTLSLTGGSIQGTMTARDGALANLKTGINTLATQLINEVNAVHTNGSSLDGTTGALFFTGTNATDIGVNATLLGDPRLVQAAANGGANGDNTTALALAQLAQKKISGLGSQTFSENYGQKVAAFGQELSQVNTDLGVQTSVEDMLLRQRDSISGVSMDEEMADLTRFQKAFAASARLITTVDDMLDTVVNLKR